MGNLVWSSASVRPMMFYMGNDLVYGVVMFYMGNDLVQGRDVLYGQ